MAEHAWTVLCLTAPTNNETHNISLQDVVEEVQLRIQHPRVPGATVVFHAGWVLVTTWRRTDMAVGEAVEERMEFVAPDGRVLIGPIANRWSLLEVARTRSIANVQNLPVTESGVYRFRVAHRRPGEAEWHPGTDYLVTISLAFAGE